MPALSGATLSHGQREYVDSVVETLYQNESDFVKRLDMKADKKPTNYRGRRVALETNPNPSLAFGNIAGGDLATPSSPDMNHLLIPYIWMNLGLEIDYEAMLNNAKGMVTDAIRRAVESTGRQMVKWLNIYASNGDGTTKLAVASAAYDGTNATTRKTFIANGATDTIGATQVLAGQRVKFYDPTGTTQRVGTVGSAAISVSSVTKINVVTMTDLPSDYVSGDILVPEGTSTTGIKGIPYIVNNTGSYFGLTRSGVPTLQSTIVSGAGGLTASLLLSAYAQMWTRTGTSGMKGEGMIEFASNVTQWAAYYGLTTATGMIQFNHGPGGRPNIDIGGAGEDFTWFGVPWRKYLDFPGNAIYMLNFRYLTVASLKEAGEMLDPFNEFLPAFNGTTSVYRAAKQQWWDVAREHYSAAPHRHGAITGLPVAGLPQQKS